VVDMGLIESIDIDARLVKIEMEDERIHWARRGT
jgi:metal-sulfur cluster biosynthetic enzyme